ncbi:MAG: hypothetical protein HYX75_24065 [Acidobacteria bacterium]|nr:hypothetical protein [Acidobacteriota bacterium]
MRPTGSGSPSSPSSQRDIPAITAAEYSSTPMVSGGGKVSEVATGPELQNLIQHTAFAGVSWFQDDRRLYDCRPPCARGAKRTKDRDHIGSAFMSNDRIRKSYG